ncbi:MAG TPA: hypothetical protein VLD18_06690, partial [Verrucomicrobiae bacterium]|nr:hypothetical protein [Verrucomicrobiae bacterium]
MNWKATCYPILIGTLLVCAGLRVGAQTTGFTYQGRLLEGGSPASGSFDLRFTVHAQPEQGGPLSGAITNAGVVVTGGLFTTLLDFGAEVFDGGERWLEVAVKPAGSQGEFATLTPRQQLSATPYAIKAWQAATVPAAAITSGMLSDGAVTTTKLAPGAASQLGTPDETNPSVVAISNDGRVGVGTNSPVAGLHVANTVQTLGLELLSEQVNGSAGVHYLGRPTSLKLSGQLLAVA